MTYSRRHIDVTFQLGKGSFGEDGFDTVKLTGLRVMATISKAGGVGMNNAQVRIYGMTPDLMNQLSTLGKPIIVFERVNKITIEAGSDDEAMAIVFQGIIIEAWADGQAAPEIAFVISAVTGLIDAVKPIPPTSYQGAASVAVIMAQLAQQMGITFENNGVQVVLSNPYFPGTARMQAEACAKAANINWIIDDGTLAIWPKNSSRGALIPLISAKTGMVGYPAWTANGLIITTLYNPAIIYGAKVKVESVLKTANGEWTVFSVVHDIESEVPGGQWFSKLQCSLLDHVPVS